jgi:hypothetical protein
MVSEMETNFVFTEVPEKLLKLAGEPDKGTRIYRREGSHEEMTEWFDRLCVPLDALVSPGGAAVYAGVTRAGVYKRMRAGKLTAFCFHITQVKKTLFGGRKLLKHDPLVYVPVPECQAWRKELEGRVARIEKTKQLTADDEAALDEAEAEYDPQQQDFLDHDPKDNKRKNVRKPYPWEERE